MLEHFMFPSAVKLSWEIYLIFQQNFAPSDTANITVVDWLVLDAPLIQHSLINGSITSSRSHHIWQRPANKPVI